MKNFPHVPTLSFKMKNLFNDEIYSTFQMTTEIFDKSITIFHFTELNFPG